MKSFPGTSKTNLVVSDRLDVEEPVTDLQALVDQHFLWKAIRAESNEIPNVVYAQGSPLENSNTVKTLPTYSGLVGTVLTAFNTHQNLQFRPDDVWVAILVQFAAYINGGDRAEQLRSKIVDFEGQMQLEVVSGGTLATTDFGAMTRAFLDLISQNIRDATLREWFLPGFTTTTPNDEIVASALAMCSFQSYFSYLYSLVCGIPEITLLGTVDDWKALRAKVERLIDFDTEDEQVLSKEWVPMLRVILDNFVESAENGSQNNLPFWDQIVLFEAENRVCTYEHFVTGWIGAFSFFDSEGQRLTTPRPQPSSVDDGGTGTTRALQDGGFESPWPRINLDSLFHSIATCPAEVDDNGVKYNATLIVGQMTFAYHHEGVGNGAGNGAVLPQAVQSSTEKSAMRLLQSRNDWALAVMNRTNSWQPLDYDRMQQDAVLLRDSDQVCNSTATELPFLPPASSSGTQTVSPATSAGSSSLGDRSGLLLVMAALVWMLQIRRAR